MQPHQARKVHKAKYRTPGPGAYDSHTAKEHSTRLVKPPAYSFPKSAGHKPLESTDADMMAGPGSYESGKPPPRTPGGTMPQAQRAAAKKMCVPKWMANGKEGVVDVPEDNPAPTSYTPTIDMVRPKSPAHAIPKAARKSEKAVLLTLGTPSPLDYEPNYEADARRIRSATAKIGQAERFKFEQTTTTVQILTIHAGEEDKEENGEAKEGGERVEGDAPAADSRAASPANHAGVVETEFDGMAIVSAKLVRAPRYSFSKATRDTVCMPVRPKADMVAIGREMPRTPGPAAYTPHKTLHAAPAYTMPRARSTPSIRRTTQQQPVTPGPGAYSGDDTRLSRHFVASRAVIPRAGGHSILENVSGRSESVGLDFSSFGKQSNSHRSTAAAFKIGNSTRDKLTYTPVRLASGKGDPNSHFKDPNTPGPADFNPSGASNGKALHNAPQYSFGSAKTLHSRVRDPADDSAGNAATARGPPRSGSAGRRPKTADTAPARRGRSPGLRVEIMESHAEDEPATEEGKKLVPVSSQARILDPALSPDRVNTQVGPGAYESWIRPKTPGGKIGTATRDRAQRILAPDANVITTTETPGPGAYGGTSSSLASPPRNKSSSFLSPGRSKTPHLAPDVKIPSGSGAGPVGPGAYDSDVAWSSRARRAPAAGFTTSQRSTLEVPIG